MSITRNRTKSLQLAAAIFLMHLLQEFATHWLIQAMAAEFEAFIYLFNYQYFIFFNV